MPSEGRQILSLLRMPVSPLSRSVEDHCNPTLLEDREFFAIRLRHLRAGTQQHLRNPIGVRETASGKSLKLLFHVVFHAPRVDCFPTCLLAEIHPLLIRRWKRGIQRTLFDLQYMSELRSIVLAIAWQCAGPIDRVRRINRSKVPCSSSIRSSTILPVIDILAKLAR